MQRRIFRISDDGNIGSLARLLSQVTQAGKVLRVTVEIWRNPRTVDQNKRYWRILNLIAAAAPPHLDGQWYAPEVWHEHFKRKFLGVQPGPFGDVVPNTTTKLSTVEFSGYCDQIEAWAAGEGMMLGGE